MKFLLTAIFTVITFVFLSGQPTACLKLELITSTETELVVSLQINGSESFELGSSNLQFEFDDDALSNPRLELDGLPGPPFYQLSTVTTPFPGQCSYNIELGFAGFGNTMSGPGGWTEVGQVRFDKTGTTFDLPMSWSYNGGTTETVIFLDDESTQLLATSISCLEGLSISVLPVNYESFTVEKEGKDALIKWSTSSETSNHGFFIAHSSNGRAFTEIGFVAGRNSPGSYHFVHNQPATGPNFYRLVQEDHDGAQATSEVKLLYFGPEQQKLLAFPNPVDETLHFSGLLVTENTLARLYSAQAGLVLERKGVSQLPVGHLPAGVYLLELVSNNVQLTKKVLISH